VLLLAAGPWGCGTHTRPISAVKEPSSAEGRFQAIWQASLAVLRDHDFRIELTDRRAGLITTAPTTGRQWFEFWRRDSTRGDVLENSLHTIYRRAEVRIEPTAPKADTYAASVTVHVSRSNRQAIQITNASEAHSLFTQPTWTAPRRRRLLLDYGEGAPVPAEAEGPAGAAIVTGITPLGRDPKLEKRIAAEIHRRAGRP
jgi:hypothetical protein